MASIGCASVSVPASVPEHRVEIADERALDSLRWWVKADSSPLRELVEETPEQFTARVPVRMDPKIIVMMYHNLVFGRTGGEYNRDIYNFEHDLVFLRNRTKIVGLGDLADIQSGTMRIETDISAITFDDGDLSIYAIAFPILKRFDIKATFFVITDYVGTTGYVSWAQLKEMAEYRNERGERLFSIGSHSIDHKRFDEIPADKIPWELSESKAIIERNTGFPVEYFALPFGAGAGRKEIIDAAKTLGYLGIRSSDWKVQHPKAVDMFNIPAYYVTNERSDVIVGKIYRALGR
jgi:peptidoglycan/xylan/chitin deacetylase (PgdA/CDA1 family)